MILKRYRWTKLGLPRNGRPGEYIISTLRDGEADIELLGVAPGNAKIHIFINPETGAPIVTNIGPQVVFTRVHINSDLIPLNAGEVREFEKGAMFIDFNGRDVTKTTDSLIILDIVCRSCHNSEIQFRIF